MWEGIPIPDVGLAPTNSRQIATTRQIDMIPEEILKKVQHIHIRARHTVNDVLTGQYESVFKGQGMEFEEVREYQPGDDIRSIDWNVTARMCRPFLKKFVEERELTVMLVIDASSSSRFGSVKQLKAELTAELCAVLAFSAIKNNDKVGLIIFTDRVEKYIPPKKGRRHVLHVISEALSFHPQGHRTNVAVALEYLNRVTIRRNRHLPHFGFYGYRLRTGAEDRQQAPRHYRYHRDRPKGTGASQSWNHSVRGCRNRRDAHRRYKFSSHS